MGKKLEGVKKKRKEVRKSWGFCHGGGPLMIDTRKLPKKEKAPGYGSGHNSRLCIWSKPYEEVKSGSGEGGSKKRSQRANVKMVN